jgi:monoamine oxidase
VTAAPFPTLYNNNPPPRAIELDHMSVRTWINSYVPGGFGSRLGQLLDVAYNIEYGAETTVQSSLNMAWRPVSAPPARSSTPSAEAPEPGDGQPGP